MENNSKMWEARARQMAFENALKSYTTMVSGADNEMIIALLGDKEAKELSELGMTKFCYKKTEELFKTYPSEQPVQAPTQPTQTAPRPAQPRGRFVKPEVSTELKCDFCHASLVKTKDGTAWRCPNWKMDKSGCQGTYVKIGEENRARREDNITDEANNPEFNPNEQYSPEYR